jgi:hypothetical protein
VARILVSSRMLPKNASSTCYDVWQARSSPTPIGTTPPYEFLFFQDISSPSIIRENDPSLLNC